MKSALVNWCETIWQQVWKQDLVGMPGITNLKLFCALQICFTSKFQSFYLSNLDDHTYSKLLYIIVIEMSLEIVSDYHSYI